MNNAYPLPAFSFSVSLHGLPSGPDASFSEVSGLEAERTFEEVREGGENRFAHRLPGHTRSRDLVLKRGIINAASPLREWVRQTLESDLGTMIQTIDLDVSLLDAEGSPVMAWSVTRAWPLRFNIAALDAARSEVAVESLVLSYAQLRQNPVRVSVGLFF